jgi:ankyrin repeat protein
MVDNGDLRRLLVAIGTGDRDQARTLMDAQPALATGRLARADEFFLPECHAQFYQGDTPLHAAAFAYDRELAQDLVARGAGIRTRNRRGAEPLHAAVAGGPGPSNWNPARQREVIEYHIAAGADPNATALGGVTPLHRAVRNRCSVAVDALLAAGADPRLANDNGSAPHDLARWTTGRGGTGSPAAKAEQQAIIDRLDRATA